MAKWWQNVTRVKLSKNDKRFYSSFDMAEAKREEARVNALVKRGEIPKGNYRYMCDCRCGASGCIICREVIMTDYDKKKFKDDYTKLCTGELPSYYRGI